MPRVTPVAEVRDLEPDQIIMCMRGTLTKVYDRNDGTNSTGDWAIQNVVLKDRTGEIKVMVKDREEVDKSWRGKEVILEAHHGDKGYTGVYAYDDDYKGKLERRVKLTPTGQLYLASGNGAGNGGGGDEGDYPQQQRKAAPQSQSGGQTGHSRAPQPPQQAAPAKQPPPPAAPPPDRATVEANAVKAAKVAAARNANLYCVAIDAVGRVVAPHFQRVMNAKMDAGQVQAAISTLYISMRDDALDAQLPVRPLEPPKPAAPPPAAATPPPAARPPRAQQPPPPDDDEIPF